MEESCTFELMHAMWCLNDDDAVIAAIKAHPDQLRRPMGPNSYTPLQLAAEAGRVRVVEALLKAGVPADDDLTREMTPLMLAINLEEPGYSDVVDLLIGAGANVSYVSGDQGETPLHYAAWKGDPSVCFRLLKAGADVNKKNTRGETPLAVAVKLRNDTAAIVLRAAGAAPIHCHQSYTS